MSNNTSYPTKIKHTCIGWGEIRYDDCEECGSYNKCRAEWHDRGWKDRYIEERIIPFRDEVSKLWSDETKYPKSEPNEYGTKSRGQCYVTAFLTWTRFGGDIMKCHIKKLDETHYWNRINKIGEVDLTSDQYGGDGRKPKFCGKPVKGRDWDNPRVRLMLELYDSSPTTKMGAE